MEVSRSRSSHSNLFQSQSIMGFMKLSRNVKMRNSSSIFGGLCGQTARRFLSDYSPCGWRASLRFAGSKQCEALLFNLGVNARVRDIQQAPSVLVDWKKYSCRVTALSWTAQRPSFSKNTSVLPCLLQKRATLLPASSREPKRWAVADLGDAASALYTETRAPLVQLISRKCPQGSRLLHNGSSSPNCDPSGDARNSNDDLPALGSGSYSLFDRTTSSDPFINCSVKSVKDALQRRVSSTGNAKNFIRTIDDTENDEKCFLESHQREAEASTNKTARGRRQRMKDGLFDAIADSDLANLVPDNLSIQQLLYVLGRACTLANPRHEDSTSTRSLLPPGQWQAFFNSLRRRAHELGPIEITRAFQTLAYSKNVMHSGSQGVGRTAESASLAEEWRLAGGERSLAFEELQRHIAEHVHLLQGDCLSRVVYASLKGGFPENTGFIEFVCEEGEKRTMISRSHSVFLACFISITSNGKSGVDNILPYYPRLERPVLVAISPCGQSCSCWTVTKATALARVSSLQVEHVFKGRRTGIHCQNRAAPCEEPCLPPS